MTKHTHIGRSDVGTVRNLLVCKLSDEGGVVRYSVAWEPETVLVMPSGIFASLFRAA